MTILAFDFRGELGMNDPNEAIAMGYINEVVKFSEANRTCYIANQDIIIITLPICEKIRDDLLGSEGLYKSLKILMQAGILKRINIDVIKDGETFDCNELSKVEKQLVNLVSTISLTNNYSVFFCWKNLIFVYYSKELRAL